MERLGKAGPHLEPDAGVSVTKYITNTIWHDAKVTIGEQEQREEKHQNKISHWNPRNDIRLNKDLI